MAFVFLHDKCTRIILTHYIEIYVIKEKIYDKIHFFAITNWWNFTQSNDNILSHVICELLKL